MYKLCMCRLGKTILLKHAEEAVWHYYSILHISTCISHKLNQISICHYSSHCTCANNLLVHGIAAIVNNNDPKILYTIKPPPVCYTPVKYVLCVGAFCLHVHVYVHEKHVHSTLAKQEFVHVRTCHFDIVISSFLPDQQETTCWSEQPQHHSCCSG